MLPERALLLADVNDLLDEEGRPIGEVRASGQARAGVRTVYRTCPYPGSRGRSGLPMNVSAVRQVGRNWAAVLGTVEFLRRAYQDREPSGRPPLLHLARMSRAGLALPAYVLFREDGAGAVPAFLAATHKMLAGVFGLCKNLLLCQVALGLPYDRVAVDDRVMAEFAENSGMLVGQSGAEVCAGPPGLISEVLRLLAGGGPAVNAARQPIEALRIDRAAWLDYAEIVDDLTLWEIVMAIRTRELTVAAAGRSVPSPALPHLGDLGPEAAEEMIKGMLPLFTRLRPGEGKGELFDASLRPHSEPLIAWLPGVEPAYLRHLARCLHAERQALALCARLRADAYRALGRTPPPAGPLYQGLASDAFARRLGIGIRVSADGAVLTRGTDRLHVV